ncbi:DUF5615 family PIN-like protein [Polymorphobacter multimanifer]|uniref:DUF5615 family PIN-like protein n=1 Tax=Polymorphobacter multimanifer TaxID=1070431 RepID=UPI001607A334|nr:DUF5615 family PIN-like protein [Polymorphobacter multimanifer]
MLSSQLRELGHESWHIGELAALDATDVEVCAHAADRQAVIITKDADFLRLALATRPPLQLLWVRLGNCSNARLVEQLIAHLGDAVSAFANGEQIVELR